MKIKTFEINTFVKNFDKYFALVEDNKETLVVTEKGKNIAKIVPILKTQ